MFVRSTGLGRTLLRGRIAAIQNTDVVPATLEPSGDHSEPVRMLMVMEILHPVHWTVRAFVDPADLRQMIWMVLKNPGLILRGIKFLFSRNPVYEAPDIPERATPAVAAQPKPGAATMPTPASKAGPGPIPARS